MSVRVRISTLVSILISSSAVQAEDFLFSMSAAGNKTAGNLVWNRSEGSLHVEPRIQAYQTQTGPVSDRDFSVGDGRHGDFVMARYQDFSEGGDLSGNIIRLSTERFPLLQFRSFHLAPGWTLHPTGSLPLKILSQSQIIIEGIIDCSGERGTEATADETQRANGGNGFCGGGNGGSGGTFVGGSFISAGNGESGGSSLSPALAPANDGVTAAAGGAGGGGYSQLGTSAGSGSHPDAGAVSTPGSNFWDDAFLEEGGGSGGSGGAAFATGDITENSGGAGGGGGGGMIWLAAFGDISVTAGAAVVANGGDGGSVPGGWLAGAGGGGGGGSIAMFSAGDIRIDGTVSAQMGAGGTSAAGGSGGNGATGRTWVVDRSGAAAGASVELPDTQLTSRGQVVPQQGSYFLETRSIDLWNSAPVPQQALFSWVDQGASDIEVLYASDEFAEFSPDFFAIHSFTDLTAKRFARLRVELTQAAGANFSKIQNLGFRYQGRSEQDFDLQASCGLVKTTAPADLVWVLLLLLPLLLYLFLRLQPPWHAKTKD